MRVKIFAWDRHIIKSARPLAGIIQPDQKILARQPAKDRAAQQTLQINDQVELLGAHPADAVDHFRPVKRMSPAPTFETDQSRQVRIAFQERGQRGVDPPENLRLAKML